MVDGLARIFTDQSPEPSDVELPVMIITEDNLPSEDKVFPMVPEYQSQFKALWGVQ